MGRASNSRDVESLQGHPSSSWCDWVAVLVWSVLGYLGIMLMVIGYCHPSLLPLDSTLALLNKQVTLFITSSESPSLLPKPQGVEVVTLVAFSHHERTTSLNHDWQVRSLFPLMLIRLISD